MNIQDFRKLLSGKVACVLVNLFCITVFIACIAGLVLAAIAYLFLH